MPCTSTSIISGEEGCAGGVARCGAGFWGVCAFVVVAETGTSAVVLGLVVKWMDWEGGGCGGAVGRVP